MPKKYLLLTASYGSGHNAAAGAIESYLLDRGDYVDTLDLTELLKKGGDNSRKFYSFTEKMPFLWDATFTLLDQQFTNEILDLIFKSIYQKKFNEYMQECKPDVVINTFPNWPIFLKNYCKLYEKDFKTGTIITDAIEIGMPWYFGSNVIDEFFVIDKNSRSVFKKKFKHKKNNVNVSFFPIDEKYFFDKNSIKNKHIAILLTGLKMSFVNEFMHKMIKEDFYDKIHIMRGRNDKVFNKIRSKYKDPRFDFIEVVNIKDVLKDMDIFIGKPGGAITCECIAQDVPLIAPSYIPGQEEGNIKLLEKERIGIYEDDIEKIIFYLRFIDWNKFLPNLHEIKKKNSVEYIIKKLGR